MYALISKVAATKQIKEPDNRIASRTGIVKTHLRCVFILRYAQDLALRAGAQNAPDRRVL